MSITRWLTTLLITWLIRLFHMIDNGKPQRPRLQRPETDKDVEVLPFR